MVDKSFGLGRRSALKTVGSAIGLGLVGSGTTAIGAVDATAETTGEDSWPQIQYNLQNTGYNPSTVAPRGESELEWRWRGSGQPVRVVGQPVTEGDTLYCGVRYDAYGLFALDRSSGSEKWYYETEHGVAAAPAVVDGTVYVAERDRSGTVHAVDSETGEREWETELGTSVARVPLVVGDLLYIGTQRGVFALDPATGEEEWVFYESGRYNVGVAVAGDTVFTADRNPHATLYALDADSGSKNWETALTGSITTAGAPCVVDDTLYVGTETFWTEDEGDYAYAIDVTDGAVLWETAVPNGCTASPAVAKGTVCMRTGSGSVYCVDAPDGGELWHNQDVKGGQETPPAIAEDVAYVHGMTDDGWVVQGLELETGNGAYTAELPGSSESAPIVVDGTVYIGTPFGVHAIGTAVSQEPPEAAFTIDPPEVAAGEQFTVDASASDAPGATIDEYQWAFGDGTTITSTSPVTEHSYDTGGEYSIKLTVTASNGLSDTTEQDIEVTIELEVVVKPDDEDSAPINPRSNGVTPVAILNTAEIDPTTAIDRSTLRFGPPLVVEDGAGASPAHGGTEEDVTGDGTDDLVVKFPTSETEFEDEDDIGMVAGETDQAITATGTDHVRIVGGGNGHRNGNGGGKGGGNSKDR